jgi:hypothetical protein
MKSKQLRALSDELIRDLGLDKSATVETVCQRLCQVMAERLGRPITLRFDDLGATGVSGLWAATADGVQVIIVTTTRSWMHRLLILLHEVAHMLCGHEPSRLDTAEGQRLLFPDLSPQMLNILAGRTDLSQAEEREADQVAGALTRGLIQWAGKHRVEPFQPDGDGPVTRMWYSMGFSPERGQR